MVRMHLIAIASIAGLLLAAPVARAQVVDPIHYTLTAPPSDFEWGCFGPCECPVLVRGPMVGGFSLRLSNVGPIYSDYDVLGVQWKVQDGSNIITITGSGTYRRGGEAANMDQLVLDLSFNGEPAQHFDSGLVPTTVEFPAIQKRISLHQEFCHDTVLTVAAKPGGSASVDPNGTAASLTLAPNPFDSGTTFAFTLARDAVVDLAVFHVSGRRVRSIVASEAMRSGPYARAWNGHFDDGRVAPAGLYLVRLRTPASVVTRALSKLH